MTARDFISRVVPWPTHGEGVVNLHWTAPDGKGVRGRPFIDLDEFFGMVDWCNDHPAYVKDIYYCLSLQSETKDYNGKKVAKRLAANAVALKAVWFDIDGNKEPPHGYPSLNAALAAVAAFCTATGLPTPTAIICSGHGLHVYWISNRPLAKDEWAGYATGLYEAALQHGLHCDPVTTDAARILRVPGTFNLKTQPGKEVKILGLRSEDYDFSVDLAKWYKPGVKVQRLNGNKLNPIEGIKSDKFKLITPEPFWGCETLVEWEPVYQGCAFLRDAYDTGGKDYTQPMWNLTTLAATFLEDGNALAHRFGNQHAGYSYDDTESLWSRKQAERADRGVGWPSCSAINKAGCSACSGCPHFGKITSPLTLRATGRRTVSKPSAPNGDIPGVGEPGAGIGAGIRPPPLLRLPSSIELPDGYSFNEDGYPCREIEVETRKGVFDTRQQRILLCKIVEQPWAETKPGRLHMRCSTSVGNETDLELSMEEMSSMPAMLTALGRAEVKWEPPAKKYLEDFFMHYLEKLNLEKAARKAVPFGWQTEEGKTVGFAYASRLFMANDGKQPCGTGDMMTRADYTPVGEIEPWFKALKLVTGQNRPELEVLTAVAFGAPIMGYTGLPNATVAAYGSPGGNKSTAIEIGLAVWGGPKVTKMKPDATKKALLHKMGQLRNLPIYWDDVKREDTEKVMGTINSLSLGGEGNTLTSNRQQRHTGTWESLLVLATNHAITDEIISRNRNDAATLYRTFEFAVEKPEQLGPRMPHYEALQIMRDLENNFGRMGEKYAAVLGNDPQGVDDAVHKVTEWFANEVGAQEVERYWTAICAAIITGAMMANRLGCDFHIPEMSQFLKDAYRANRDKIKTEAVQSGTADNTSDNLTYFLKECAGNTLRVRNVPSGPGRPKVVDVVSGPRIDAGRAIHVQWGLNQKVLRLSKKRLTDFLDSQGISASNVFRGLKTYFNAKPSKANLAAGAPYNNSQEPIIVIPVIPGTPLWDTMWADVPADQREALSKEEPSLDTQIPVPSSSHAQVETQQRPT